ncbi:MAG: helix-turn-helix transcriptional regulator [Porphyromonadaceae bacterium]|nr:helix-turn-helix transcriptional regulator [Porphyromonadaceae bacterium]
MITEPTVKLNTQHIGANVRRVRMYFGVKQGALASDLGISQQEVSKIERQDEIEEGMVTRIAIALSVPTEVIRNFDAERAIFNINNIIGSTFLQAFPSVVSLEQSATLGAPQISDPLGKIVELYERLLKSEKEKIELLINK